MYGIEGLLKMSYLIGILLLIPAAFFILRVIHLWRIKK